MKPAEYLWNSIHRNLSDDGIELPTVPTILRTPLWFRAITDGDCISIQAAKYHEPKSKIQGNRKIRLEEFISVYPFYFKRKSGEQVSKIVQGLTRNQVYIYGLINEFEEDPV